MSMDDKIIKKEQAQAPIEVERTKARKVFVPKTDIYETKDTVVLITDMAGVDQNSIDITLEKNVLTIYGYVEPPNFENYSIVYSEYDTGDYQRSFTISNAVDREKIEAQIKNGVLRVTLHKAEQSKARKIAIKKG